MDSVLLYWDDLLLMVGPCGDPIRYIYDEPIILIPECDGVRILSNTSMEFLQREKFQDESLRIIRSSLPEAVEGCIDAASHEFDVARQRTLLRAASYGQAFCSHSQRDRFQEMCKSQRILNAVRNPEIGVPMSIQQYKSTVAVLISHLINGHHHLLALMISEYLGMNQETQFYWRLLANIQGASQKPHFK